MDSKRKVEDEMERCFAIGIAYMEEDEENGTKEMPPGGIVKFHDLLEKFWGWDKLVRFTKPASWAEYINYLEAYHSHNACKLRPGMVALAKTCHQKEKHLASLWNTLRAKMDIVSLSNSIILNCLICERAQSVIWTTGCSFSDVCSAALLCLSKEADLICELLVRDVDPNNDYIIDRSNEIRLCALSLMNCTSSLSVAASAAMLGIAKEAEVMCEWMRKNDRPLEYFYNYDPLPVEIVEGRRVRRDTLYVMIKILEASSSPTGHKIGREESASTIGPGSNGYSIATDEATSTTGGCLPDVLNYPDLKIKEAEKCKKGNIKGEDLEKLLGRGRLLPPAAFGGWSDYSIYLEKYYSHNALDFVAEAAAIQNHDELLLDPAFGAVHIATTAGSSLIASVIVFYLKMEERLLSEWKPRAQCCPEEIPPSSTVILSSLIKERVLSICGTEGGFSIHSAIAFVCIAKEADLMTELLKHGAMPTDDIIELISVIRMCTLGLANLKGRQSIAAAAAMMGVAKEARIMCDWIKRENKVPSFNPSEPHELEARLFWFRTLDFMTSILQESVLLPKVQDDAMAHDTRMG